MQKTQQRRSGFTIVELLIVIVVIGILASISVVAYKGVTTKAWNMKVTSLVRQYIQAIELYKIDTGTYPQAEAEYVCLPGTFPAKDGFALNSCEIKGLAGVAAKQTTVSNLNPGLALKAVNPDLPDASYGMVVTGTLGGVGLTQSKARGLLYSDDGLPHLLYHLMDTSTCPMGSVQTQPGVSGIVCEYYFE